MKLRRSALLLAVLLTASSLAACGGDADNGSVADTTAAVTTTPESTSELEARLALPDNLPNNDYEGKTFNILSRDRSDFVDDIGHELEITGNLIYDTIYERNKTIEDRFNISITGTFVENDGKSTHATAEASILAGDDAFALVENQVTQMAKVCTTGCYLDWYTQLPYVDLTQPWYIGNAAEALSVNEHAYAMIGEFNLDVLRFTYCMYYNLDIAESYGLDNIYEVVDDGRWTYEYIKMLADTVYDDLNGDGIKDFDDRLALSGDPHSAVVTYQYAFDCPVASHDEDGYPYISMDREKAHDIVVKLNALYWESIGGLTKDWGSGGTTWSGNNLLCYTGLFQHAIGFSDLEFDFAIIPYPKYDEKQESYYTMSDGAHGTLMVPLTVSDPEMVSIITEALNAETYKTVVPAYFDTALKVRYSRDEDSARMLDLLMDCRVFDFGYMYGTGIEFSISRLVKTNSNNSESEFTSNLNKAEIEFAKVVEEYKKLEDSLG